MRKNRLIRQISVFIAILLIIGLVPLNGSRQKAYASAYINGRWSTNITLNKWYSGIAGSSYSSTPRYSFVTSNRGDSHYRIVLSNESSSRITVKLWYYDHDGGGWFTADEIYQQVTPKADPYCKGEILIPAGTFEINTEYVLQFWGDNGAFKVKVEEVPAKPGGKVIIRNTIANSAQKTNDVIWDKSRITRATHYEINWKKRGAKKWNSATVGNTIRGGTKNLTIGGLYEIRVRPKRKFKSDGVTVASNGAWSNSVYRYFHTTQKIRLKSASKGSFTMSWKKNPAATSYQVMYSTKKNGAGAANNIRTVGANATSFTQKGLRSGVTYYVQVREIKRVGKINYIGNISKPVAVRVR